IILTKSGAKLLDFGLAKAESRTSAAATMTDATPRPLPMTKMGAVIGTVPYMSPEQLDGKQVDARSDIFSLGAVLYEMVTGRRAFEGSSEFSVASAILRNDPAPISTVQPLTPPALERTIRVCLAKDPDERWQSASDLWNELRWISEGGSQSGFTSGVRASGVHAQIKIGPAVWQAVRPRIPWMLVAAFAVVAAGALLIASRSARGPAPLAFRQLNFRREAVFQAAFVGDKDTVVYSAAAADNTPQIFTVRRDYPEPQPLGPRGMALLAVSSKGELAVLVNAHYVWYRLFTGTLARMTLSGGAPREIQEGVRQADWAPDGSQLAIIREVGGKDRLEYPIGHVLREVSGYMTDVRFSPKGDRIAYFEHPRKWDDRGSVNVIDLEGKNTVLSEGYWSARGLAWNPAGDEILFSASLGGESYTVYGISLSGKRRIAYQSPGGLTIQDVSRDGQWLATRGDFRYAAMVHTPTTGELHSEDRDLSWLNTSHARALSPDGQTLLFAETALGSNYAVCLRKTDGSPVIRLGEGWPTDLSPDGKWVLAVVQSVPPKLLIYPTGAGDTRQFDRGAIENYATAQWFRDGKSVLIGGNEPGKGTRFYVQEIGDAARPVTPEGTRDGLLSSDGKSVLARGTEGKYFLYSITDGLPTGGSPKVGSPNADPRPVPGLTEADVLAHWSADGKSVLAYRRAEIP
ncbi:MAG TPA: protein kinase, partial [Rhizomicrobium sp.]|nr:protein kinase [Rhizomicrobium sp.]